MKATKEQIIAEATRRAAAQGYGENEKPVIHFVIDVMRENWTPPVVDPDVLAFREWAAKQWPFSSGATLAGHHDEGSFTQAYLAGARMARERERERAKGLVEYVEAHVRGVNVIFTHSEVLAKYRGEA
jgi:hypothetical protein